MKAKARSVAIFSRSGITRNQRCLALAALAATCLLALTLAPHAQAGKVVTKVVGSTSPGTLGGQFNNPRGIAVNQNGTGGALAGDFFVIDGGNHRVQQFRADGTWVAAFGRNTIKEAPTGGSTDLGDVYEVCTIAIDCQAGTTADGPGGELNNPQGIAIDQSDGSIYVTDQGNRRVQKFTFSGGIPAFDRAFGWDVITDGSPSDPGNVTGFQICTVAADCKIAADEAGFGVDPGGGRFGFSIGHPAVVPAGAPGAGEVLVADQFNRRVQRFEADGDFLHAFGWDVDPAGVVGLEKCTSACRAGQASGGTNLGSFAANQPNRVAIDSSGIVYTVESVEANRVQRFNAAITSASVFSPANFNATTPPSDIQVNPANDQVFVAKANATPAERRVVQLDASGAVLDTHGENAGLPDTNGLGVNTSSGRIYLSAPHRLFILGPATPPAATIDPVTVFDATSATFTGHVDPEGLPTNYRFEYSSDDFATKKTAPLVDADAGPVGSNNPVSQNVVGLEPNTAYKVRLVATTVGLGGGTVTTPAIIFTTAGAKPEIVRTGVFPGGADTSVVLFATIDPQSQPTSYRFHYGTDTSYGGITALEPIGSSAHGEVVVARLNDLTPGTTYHFKAIATNASGTVESADQTFVAQASGACPNEALRHGSSKQLPDCRAYEMVSPIDKNGGDIDTAEQEAGEGSHFGSSYRQASIEGGKITFSSATAFGDAIGGHWSNQYIATRTVDGWSTHSISSRRGQTVLEPQIPFGPNLRWFTYSFVQGFAPDLSSAWVRDDNVDTLTPDAMQGYVNLYRRDDVSGSYQPLTSQGPYGPNVSRELSSDGGSNSGGLRFLGASEDLEHEIFVASAPLTPDAVPASSPSVPGRLAQLYDRLQQPTDALQRLTVKANSGTYALSAEAVRAVGTLTFSPNVSAVDVTSAGRGFQVGDVVAGTGIPAGTTVTAVGDGTLTLSQGTFSFGPQAIVALETTPALAATATAAQVQAALEALPAIGAGNVAVSGGPGDATGTNPYEIAFGGALAGEPVFALRPTNLGISGGSPASSAAVSIADPGGDLHLVSILPNGNAAASHSFAGTATHGKYVTTRDHMLRNAVSEDGSRVVWTATASSNPDTPGALYVRENPGEAQSVLDGACTEPAKACTIHVAGTVDSSNPAQFWAASDDGSRVLFSQGSHSNRSLYLFDVDAKALNPAGPIATQVLGVSATADDLSHIYFVSREAKAPGAVAGQSNLYDFHDGAYTLVGVVSADDVAARSQRFGGSTSFVPSVLGLVDSLQEPSPIHNQTRATADGRHFAFMSNSAALAQATAGYDNADQVTGRPDFEVYRYDAEGGDLACVSCNPSGARPRGKFLPHPYSPLGLAFTAPEELGGSGVADDLRAAATIPTHEHDNYASRLLSEDGDRLFFHTHEALLPRDSNGTQDVYQWQAPGSGTCDVGDHDYFASNDGCLSLISSGRDKVKSEFVDADPSGSEVYFTTDESLVPTDPGLRDIYVAKTGGGYPLPQGTAPCEGEACQTPPPPPSDPTPASAAFQGPGNPPQRASKPRPRCPKGKRRVKARGGKTRCVKRKSAKRAKRANNDRRASR